MVCVYCLKETNVVNSRHQKKSNQVWRRRKCLSCSALFTTIETIDASLALRVRKSNVFEPFSRDKLLLSLYDSLRHRKTVTDDSTALTATIISKLYPAIENAVVDRDTIVKVSAKVLKRFDSAAATSYAAFHPL